MEITKKEIKERLYELGADLCGIAGVDRFGEAPEGYHPLDVLPFLPIGNCLRLPLPGRDSGL